MTEIDRSLIGSWSTPFRVDVEAGAIRKFADAIGDPNPLYRDAAYARQYGYAGAVAPPTFPTCFRPPQEPPWFAPLDRRRVVAGHTAFTYFHPIVAGMRLECRVLFAGVDEKQGRRGAMELLRQALHGHEVRPDGTLGECIFISERTTVYRSEAQVTQRSLA